MQLTGTSAIVTGAASGLGAATAAALAAGGAQVYGLDLKASIEQSSPPSGVRLLDVDVTDPAAVRTAVDMAASSGAPLRIAVNCAGIAPSARTVSRGGAHDPELFKRVVLINLVGSFIVMSTAAEAISGTEPDANGQRGVIVNTASIAAYEGQIGQVAYAASKGGVIGMTLPAARDLSGVGIRVCTIAPGIVDTPMLASIGDEFRAGLAASVPFPQRLCQPEEYAKLALMIIEHDYLNGETIRMDGALRMAPR
jgi:NAD(P)-dependent dehydrogenase (short-subunit alcohol dehydrogenase family)